MRDFLPHRKQRDLVDRHGLEKVPGVQIDAVSASVDLGDPEEDEVDQFFREGRVVGDIMVHTVQRLRSGGSDFRPIQPRHLIFLSSWADIGVTMRDERDSADVTSPAKKCR